MALLPDVSGGFWQFAGGKFLLTDFNEASGMLSHYWGYLLFVLLAAAAFLWMAGKLAARTPVKILWTGALLLGAYVAGSWLSYVASGKINTYNFIAAERIARHTPLHNGGYFIRANDSLKKVSATKLQKITYDFQVTDTGVDVYVLVIGESVRRGNMSLYGCARATTPMADRERGRMLLFTRAVAAAPLTIIAVPMSLCPSEPDGKAPRNCADNVINLAKAAGFNTFWFSKQGTTSGSDSVIAAIAKCATQAQWLGGPYDGNLLPDLQKALAQPSKKLIVLHLQGSHAPAKKRYPAEYAKFNETRSPDDEYDNSIYYTDFLMGEIFELLKQHRASLMYYSDHALIRNPGRFSEYYHHGYVRPPREAVEIPLFIWFGDLVPRDRSKTGVIDVPYSTGDNYQLIGDWLGIKLAGHRALSPLDERYQPREKIMVRDSEQNVMIYSELPSEREE